MMARIRSVKPSFWADEKLGPLAPIDRLVFLGLISAADDAGRLPDSVRWIDGQVFPLTSDTCADSLATLAALGVIQRGRTASGQPVIQLVNWSSHQRINRPNLTGALPPITTPTGPFTDDSVKPHGTISEASLNDHGSLSETPNTLLDTPQAPDAAMGCGFTEASVSLHGAFTEASVTEGEWEKEKDREKEREREWDVGERVKRAPPAPPTTAFADKLRRQLQDEPGSDAVITSWLADVPASSREGFAAILAAALDDRLPASAALDLMRDWLINTPVNPSAMLLRRYVGTARKEAKRAADEQTSAGDGAMTPYEQHREKIRRAASAGGVH